ncbi:MAG: hypothetical protein EPO65_00575 [Dehalococcoidia bacterium]|nr:MAG: hypothetical protein EPO65_00575 [Dehalococcoidia bacterium]
MTRPPTADTDTVLAVAGNTPGQIRGPKAKLWPFPRRVHGLVTMLAQTRRKVAKALGVETRDLPVAVALNEDSSRGNAAWAEHPKWLRIRGRANTVLAKGRLTVANALALRGRLEVADGCALRFKYAFGVRRISMIVRLLVTALGAPLAKVVVHVPGARAASERTRRRIVRELGAYAVACERIGLPCVLSGDWNGADRWLPDGIRANKGADADVQAIYGNALVDFGDGGTIPEAAGTVTDHRDGLCYVPVTIPVSGVRELPEVPAAYR